MAGRRKYAPAAPRAAVRTLRAWPAANASQISCDFVKMWVSRLFLAWGCLEGIVQYFSKALLLLRSFLCFANGGSPGDAACAGVELAQAVWGGSGLLVCV